MQQSRFHDRQNGAFFNGNPEHAPGQGVIILIPEAEDKFAQPVELRLFSPLTGEPGLRVAAQRLPRADDRQR